MTREGPHALMPGDHPDPSILKDGAEYYMTFSSFEYYPGLVIWHSRDLLTWTRIGTALHAYVGAVWAPDLVKHDGRYFIYFATAPVAFAAPGASSSNFVIWANDVRGPWSMPINLHIGGIDPAHAVDEDGNRFLFLSNGRRAPLSPDGLSITGEARRFTMGGRTQTIGSSKRSRWKDRSCCDAATTSTWCPHRAAPRARPRAT